MRLTRSGWNKYMTVCPIGVVMVGVEEACGRNYENKCRE